MRSLFGRNIYPANITKYYIFNSMIKLVLWVVIINKKILSLNNYSPISSY